MNQPTDEPNAFDHVAEQYDELHGATLAASGEPVGYFARYKIDRMKRLGGPQATVLDYGCGIGNLTALLAESFDHVVGFDPSSVSLEIARRRLPTVPFHSDEALIAPAVFDVVVLAGVLHHVPRQDRRRVLSNAMQKAKPGGRVVVFEHNPYNPLTRSVVDRCAFDEDAVLLRPREIRQLLEQVGAAKVDQGYIVFFPRALARLRVVEPALSFLPFGVQTMTVATKEW